MIATLSVSVFAAEEEKGSITLNGISSTSTYEIYKLLDLESYSTAGAGAYSYKVNAAWTALFETAAAKEYFTVAAEDGYVTWTWKATEGSDKTEDEALAEFAKSALQYAKTNGILPVQSSDPNRGTSGENDFAITGDTGVFSDLELGYYLVDSTVGALCGLTTTNPNASIQAKNGAPTIDKQVKEDSNSQWGANNTADIGEVVEFRVTINVHAGAQNYVLHDEFAGAFEFVELKGIEHVTSTGRHTTPAEKYTLTVGSDKDDFTVAFNKAFCDEMATGDYVIVHYTAMLMRDATIAGAGNPNTAWLTYGEGHSTEEDITHTFTYEIDIVKTDSQNTLIDGAEFRIYDAATGGNEVEVVLTDDGSAYRRAREDETGVSIVVKNGLITVKGLDNGTYYLEETVAPDGYNKLTARQRFIVADGNLDATFNGEIFSTGSGVHVVNKTGSMLPETGAEGTILFIVIGAIAVLGAGVLLVTKKRMSMIED